MAIDIPCGVYLSEEVQRVITQALRLAEGEHQGSGVGAYITTDSILSAMWEIGGTSRNALIDLGITQEKIEEVRKRRSFLVDDTKVLNPHLILPLTQ